MSESTGINFTINAPVEDGTNFTITIEDAIFRCGISHKYSKDQMSAALELLERQGKISSFSITGEIIAYNGRPGSTTFGVVLEEELLAYISDPVQYLNKEITGAFDFVAARSQEELQRFQAMRQTTA
jgi:hypothetical protein